MEQHTNSKSAVGTLYLLFLYPPSLPMIFALALSLYLIWCPWDNLNLTLADPRWPWVKIGFLHRSVVRPRVINHYGVIVLIWDVTKLVMNFTVEWLQRLILFWWLFISCLKCFNLRQDLVHRQIGLVKLFRLPMSVMSCHVGRAQGHLASKREKFSLHSSATF